MSDDLDAIRERADATVSLRGDTPWHHRMVKSATDVPALLALVDAQAARIDKALALLGAKDPANYASADGKGYANGWNSACATARRALTEDAQ